VVVADLISITSTQCSWRRWLQRAHIGALPRCHHRWFKLLSKCETIVVHLVYHYATVYNVHSVHSSDVVILDCYYNVSCTCYVLVMIALISFYLLNYDIFSAGVSGS